MKIQKTAKIGEKLAVQHLKRQKYQVIGVNIRFREGEIDIIAKKGSCLIFVEVKTRTNWKFGYPEQALTETKKQRLAEAIGRYILETDYLGKWRADLIAIDLSDKQAKLRHYQAIELD